jgi:hypothetical protein
MTKKTKKEFGEATLISVQKEMAKPLWTKSARERELSLAAGRMTPAKRGNTKMQLRPLPLPWRARRSSGALL